MEIAAPQTAALAPATAAAEADGGAARRALSSDFETFLTMLTVQMENQDPLNPISSEDFAVQLATFAGVEQQVRTNDLLGEVAARFGTAELSQLANWVGLEARVSAPAVFDGTPVRLYPEPRGAADRAELVVTDAAGNEVQRLALPGDGRPYDWAGLQEGALLPAGRYGFAVESFVGENRLGSDPVPRYAAIAEARQEDGATVLIDAAGVRFPASSVQGLRAPGS